VLLFTLCVRNGAAIGVNASTDDDANTIAAATIALMDDVVVNIMIYMCCGLYNKNNTITIAIFLIDNKYTALFET
jgi:hypothetical protein